MKPFSMAGTINYYTFMAIPEKVTFNNKTSREFGRTVKKRVDAYFKENNLSKHANTQMVVKTIIMLSFYLIPYLLIISVSFQQA
jgi:linoleoyl-CoA desaturase